MADIPKIFDALKPGEDVPKGFSAVKIVLDGRVESDLNWDAAKKEAESAIDRGLAIFWEIQMGLFSDLPHPLLFETQVRTLQLALHTFERDIWSAFGDNSLGLCIYRGGCDFTVGFPWLKVIKGEDHHDNLRAWLKESFDDEATFSRETGIACEQFSDLNYRILLQNRKGHHLLNLFCRNVSCDYLDLLTQSLSDAVPLFILLDTLSVNRLSDLAQILSRERFPHYHVVVKGGNLPIQGLAWDNSRGSAGYISRRALPLQDEELSATALCLPPVEVCRPSQFEGLEEAMADLKKRLIHYRIIPEPHLVSEWHGLDEILVVSKAVTDEGKRMLQGFCAAGGMVVVIGELMGLSQEMSFSEWTEKLLERM